MKKNYNYAYDNLFRAWDDSVVALKSNNLEEMAQVLGEFKFTHLCLKKLKDVIYRLEEMKVDQAVLKHSTESLGLLHDSLPSSLAEPYPSMLEDVDEKVMTSYEMQIKMSCYLLERTKQDFETMYESVKSDLTEICQSNNIMKFEELLPSSSPWMVGALTEVGKMLSIHALLQGNFKMFSLIALNDPNFSQYKLELLKTVLSEKNLSALKFLLIDMYSPGEVSSLLGSKEYYASSVEVVEEVTKFLSNGSAKLSAMSYNAMFLYSNHQYDEAIHLFEMVMAEDVGRQKQVAQFYVGLCFQYSGEVGKAVAIFKSIIEGDIDEYYDKTSSIKEHAQSHLDSLDSISGKQVRIGALEKEWVENNNLYLKKHKGVLVSLLHQVYEDMNSPSKLTVSVKKVLGSLSKIKFISLKQEAPKEIVSAREFSDLPGIYSSMTSKMDKAELDEYHQAIGLIGHSIDVVGETTAGLVVTDVL